MKVKLVIGTINDPGTKVVVNASVKFTTVEAIDRWLKAQKIARDWLAKELGK